MRGVLRHNIVFKTDQLSVCRGLLTEIPYELWDDLVSGLSDLHVDIMLTDEDPAPEYTAGKYPTSLGTLDRLNHIEGSTGYLSRL